jgi:hypothetical protein
MTPRSLLQPRTAAAACAVVAALVVTVHGQSARQGAPAAPAISPVADTALERLLPSPPGWTRGRVNRDRIDLTESCVYSFADAVYINAAMKVRITIADAAFDQSALGVIATMVVSFPSTYSQILNSTTSIKRIDFNGSPAALRWDSAAGDGEFTVVIGKRFVVKAEGSAVDSPDTLRAMIELVDLKALAGLK